MITKPSAAVTHKSACPLKAPKVLGQRDKWSIMIITMK